MNEESFNDAWVSLDDLHRGMDFIGKKRWHQSNKTVASWKSTITRAWGNLFSKIKGSGLVEHRGPDGYGLEVERNHVNSVYLNMGQLDSALPRYVEDGVFSERNEQVLRTAMKHIFPAIVAFQSAIEEQSHIETEAVVTDAWHSAE